jgi:hypothetical protein
MAEELYVRGSLTGDAIYGFFGRARGPAELATKRRIEAMQKRHDQHSQRIAAARSPDRQPWGRSPAGEYLRKKYPAQWAIAGGAR